MKLEAILWALKSGRDLSKTYILPIQSKLPSGRRNE